MASSFFGWFTPSKKPYSGSISDAKDALKKLKSLQSEGYIRKIESVYEYHVYRYRKGVHKAVAFRDENTAAGKYFILGLALGDSGLIPQVEGAASGSSVTEVGKVSHSARYLLNLALNILEKFGAYDLMTNNCQNFTNILLMGLGFRRESTDPEVATFPFRLMSRIRKMFPMEPEERLATILIDFTFSWGNEEDIILREVISETKRQSGN